MTRTRTTVKITTVRKQIGRFTNFTTKIAKICIFNSTFLESFRFTSSTDMSNPVTPFRSSFNERNTRKYDLDNNWFGNRNSQRSNIFKEYCDATKFIQPTRGYSNNSSLITDSFVHLETELNIEMTPILPTILRITKSTNMCQLIFNPIVSITNIFEGMYHGISLNTNLDPIPVPDGRQKIKDEFN